MSEMTREQLHDVLHKYLANGTPITVFFDIGETFDALQSQLAALRQERDEWEERAKSFEGSFNAATVEMAALRLRWTSDTPKAPGWYWFRGDCWPDKKKASIREIVPRAVDGVLCMSGWVLDCYEDGEWAGPIPLPQGREA